MDDRFHVSPLARRDLFEIWQYTCDEWGTVQADRYLRQINTSFGSIADNPEIHRERHEVDPPVRIHRMSSHLIIYRVEDENVLILRVVHGRRNWTGLFEGPDD